MTWRIGNSETTINTYVMRQLVVCRSILVVVAQIEILLTRKQKLDEIQQPYNAVSDVKLIPADFGEVHPSELISKMPIHCRCRLDCMPLCDSDPFQLRSVHDVWQVYICNYTSTSISMRMLWNGKLRL